jgi:uncharacterized membrane protein
VIKQGKKRVFVYIVGLILFILLIISAFVSAQDVQSNQTVKKKFIGSVTIKSGTPNDYTFRIVSGYPVFEISPGQKKTFILYTRKSPEGNPLHNVNVEVTNTEFPVKIENPLLPTLLNNEMGVLDMAVDMPSDAQYGDYVIKFMVESDEFPRTEFAPKPDIIVRVKKPSYVRNGLLVAGIIILISLSVWRGLRRK